MITKVSPSRGNRVRGLLEYLFGPGKSDEHTDQRVVAAYTNILVGDRGDTELGRAMLATELDMPRRMFAPKITDSFVYHVSISNPATDRDLTDVEWRDVADTAADRLGFNEGGDGAAVRWIAVHHGKSANDNDHIHLVANLIRGDGRKHYFDRADWTILGEVRREMEAKYGLTSTAPGKAGTPALSRPEVERQRASGRESSREVLRRGVRAAATAARSESEFITNAAQHGMLLRPRWAHGGREEVIGYFAARPSTATGTAELQWFGGGKLARDLTLPALRTGWDPDPAAVAAWKAIEARTAPSPRRTPVADPRLMKEANHAMASARQRLKGIPVTDHQAWSAVARDGAGVLAAVAQDMPDRRVKLPLTRAAHALAGAAWREPHHHIARPPDGGGLWKVAQNALTIGGAQAEVYGTLVLLQQVTALAETIRDNRAAAGRVAQARWAAQAAQHTRTAVDVIHTSPEPAWATQRQQARGPQPAGPRQRLTAAQLAGMFDAGPITNLGPSRSSRTRVEHDRDRDRNDKDYGR